jgi:excisionase family DNA binding protein
MKKTTTKPIENTYMRISEVSKSTGLSESTVYRALRKGYFLAYKVGKTTLIDCNSLIAFIEERHWKPVSSQKI